MSLVEKFKAAASSELHALKTIERVAEQLTDQGRAHAVAFLQSLEGKAQVLRVVKPRAPKGTTNPNQG